MSQEQSNESVVKVSPVSELINGLIEQHTATIAVLKAEIVTLKKIQKEVNVEVKELQKELSKRRKVKKTDPTQKRKPSGFAAPFVVSDALYDFIEPLGVVRGTPISRTSVTKLITGYIKDHDLQNPAFRREIIPDAPLKLLLGEPAEPKDASDPESPKVYTYLKLQRYLNPHFKVPQPVVENVETPVVETSA